MAATRRWCASVRSRLLRAGLWMTRRQISGGTEATLSVCVAGDPVRPLRMVDGGVEEELKVDGGVFVGGDSRLLRCDMHAASAAARSSSVGACCMLYPCAMASSTPQDSLPPLRALFNMLRVTMFSSTRTLYSTHER